MGTRHLTAVFHDGKYKLAQYGQWDGYPSGQGKTVLEFLKNPEFNRVELLRQLDRAIVLAEGQKEGYWVKAGAEPGAKYVSLAVSENLEKMFPTLSRNTGAKVLDHVLTAAEPAPLELSVDFAGDSLFCEWAYVIDLDKHVLEVFKGFNKTPLAEGDRFFHLQKTDEEYKPVRLVKSYSLWELPTPTRLVEDCEPSDD